MAEQHPIVDGNVRAQIVLHPQHELQLYPGGASLVLEAPLTREELAGHPLIDTLLFLGWRLFPVVHGEDRARRWALCRYEERDDLDDMTPGDRIHWR